MRVFGGTALYKEQHISLTDVFDGYKDRAAFYKARAAFNSISTKSTRMFSERMFFHLT